MQRLAIGVDIGGTRTKLGLVDLAGGSVLEQVLVPTERVNESVFLSHIDKASDHFREVAGSMGGLLAGVGIGVPSYVGAGGVVDSTYGFLPFMDGGYPLGARVGDRLGLRCVVDNDARVVGLGEALYGGGKGYERVLTLTLGTGLGVGFVTGGVFPEALPLGHMSGHMQVREQGGACYCGKRGCLEALVSSAALREGDWPGDEPRPADMAGLFGLAQEGQAAAVARVEDLVKALHTGIHNFVNLLAPDVVVLGGGIAQGLSGYEERLGQSGYLSPHTGYGLVVKVSVLQEQAGILGAAALLQSAPPVITSVHKTNQ